MAARMVVLIWTGCSAVILSGCATNSGTGATPVPTTNDEGSKLHTGADNGGDEKPAELLFGVAGDLEAHGEIDTALAVYEQAATATHDAPTYVKLANAYARAGKDDQAIVAYKSALARDPDDAEALLGLGSAWVRKNDLQKALSMLERAAPRKDTAVAYNRLGVAELLTGHPERAQVSLTKAGQRDPKDLDIATNLALAQAVEGDGDGSVLFARQIGQSPGLTARHWRNLVLVWGIAGSSAEAMRAATGKLPRDEIATLLVRAASIRALKSPAARAENLGRMIGGDGAKSPRSDQASRTASEQ